MKILSTEGFTARATDGSTELLIDLSLIGPLDPGTWVLTFLGAARQTLGEEEALKIKSALDGLQSVMTGGALGDAFADLEVSAPRLPPHLQTVFDRGETTG